MEKKPDFEKLAREYALTLIDEEFLDGSPAYICYMAGLRKGYSLQSQNERLLSALKEREWVSVKDEWPLEILPVLWCRISDDGPDYEVATMCDDGFDETYWTHWKPIDSPPKQLINEIEKQ